MRIDEYIRLVARYAIAFILALIVCFMLDATMGCSRKTTSTMTDLEVNKTYSCDSTAILQTDTLLAIVSSIQEGWWERNDSIIEYSAPDSMGNQYVVRKRISKARGGDSKKDSVEVRCGSTTRATENKNDSSYSYINKVESKTKKVEHTIPWYIYVTIFAIIATLIAYAYRWLKNIGFFAQVIEMIMG